MDFGDNLGNYINVISSEWFSWAEGKRGNLKDSGFQRIVTLTDNVT